jgi:hypothetical protein
MEPTAENLRAVIWTMAAVVFVLCLVVIRTVDCDPECSHCKAKRKAAQDLHLMRYFGPAQWCQQHQCPRKDCASQHRG